MKTERIDKLEQLVLCQLKAEDLKWQFGTGQAQQSGSGRNKTYTYRTGVQTPIGDIEISVWVKAAECLIEKYGLKEEMEHLAPYMLPYNKGDPIARRDAHARLMDACLSGLYRNPRWVRFKEYNQKYHPELLQEKGADNQNGN